MGNELRKLVMISILATCLIVLMIEFPMMAYPFDASDTEISSALDYLRSLQQDDGSISDFGTSAWATMAIAAAGEDPHTWAPNGVSIVGYLKANTNQLNLTKASDVERFVLAVTAAREDPRDVDGTDYVSVLEDLFNNGQIGDNEWLFDDFWGLLALISAGTAANSTVIEETAEFIKDNQNGDGGWGWAVGVDSDVDDTASAIMALLAFDRQEDYRVIKDGLYYLRRNQQNDGGFPSLDVTNSASDSWAIGALNAAGEDPTSRDWKKKGNHPISHLLSLHNLDGSFNWTSTDPGWVNKALMTSYAIVALCGKTYPVNGQAIYLRIEGSIETVWRGHVLVAASVIKDNQGQEHYLTDATVLGALDKAAEVGGFNYMVEETASGLYVYSINGEAAAGIEGWMYRVGYMMPWVGAGDFLLGETSPPEPPHNEVLWYHATWTDLPIKLETDKTSVRQGEEFTITTSHYNDTTAEWLALGSASVTLDGYEYTTDSKGEVTIKPRRIKPGVYLISADKSGFIRSDKIEIRIKKSSESSENGGKQNEPPVADFTYSPEHPTDLDTIHFTDSSSDPDGSIVSWYWDFGDGSDSTEGNPTHKYTNEGDYTVSLTITDDQGASDKIEKQITVLLGDTLLPYTVDDYDDLWHTEDFTITLTAKDDYSGVQATYYRINDGLGIRTLQDDGQPYIAREGRTKLEYWSVDRAGNEENHHTIEIKLDKTAPIAVAGGQTIIEDSTVSLSANGSFDNVGIVSYEWSFGDGTMGTGLTTTHTYLEPGTYTITLTVKDAAGNEDTNWISIIVFEETTTPTPSPTPTVTPTPIRLVIPVEYQIGIGAIITIVVIAIAAFVIRK